MHLSRIAWVALLASALFARAELATSPESVKPLTAGAHAPLPNIVTLDGHDTSLAEVLDGKPTVVIFFRGGWCPFCNRQLAGLAQRELDLRELGYQIIAISADPPEKMTPMLKTDHIRYRLFSDRDARASIAYGLAYRISKADGADYHANGIDLSAAPDGNGYWLPVPAAFIIDRSGVIRFVYSNPDPSVRIKCDDLIAAAKAAAK